MTHVGKREFALHTSRYLSRVEKSGEELLITDRKKPVLKIVPVEEKNFRSLKGLLKKVKIRGNINTSVFPSFDKW